MIAGLTECSKAEFRAFVETYPRKLETYVSPICDPPYRTYNDWSLGEYPTSIVAAVNLGEGSGYPGAVDVYGVRSTTS